MDKYDKTANDLCVNDNCDGMMARCHVGIAAALRESAAQMAERIAKEAPIVCEYCSRHGAPLIGCACGHVAQHALTLAAALRTKGA